MLEPLQGLTIVVTRPAHQAGHFIEQATTLGAEIICYPVISIEPYHSALTQQKLDELAHYDAAIFTSHNAVTYAYHLMSKLQQQQLGQLMLGAIGKNTAYSLKQYNLAATWVPDQGFTSEDFLAHPLSHQVQGKRIALFKGQGGRDLLAAVLQQRGASVDTIEVYQRQCPAKGSLNLGSVIKPRLSSTIIAITSSEGLSNLLTLTHHPDWIKHTTLLVGSKRILATAHQAGFWGPLVLANDPSDASMLQALNDWVQEFHHD